MSKQLLELTKKLLQVIKHHYTQLFLTELVVEVDLYLQQVRKLELQYLIQEQLELVTTQLEVKLDVIVNELALPINSTFKQDLKQLSTKVSKLKLKLIAKLTLMLKVATVDCTSQPSFKVDTITSINSKHLISTSNFRNTKVSTSAMVAVVTTLTYSSSAIITTEHTFTTSMDFVAIIISFDFTTLLIE